MAEWTPAEDRRPGLAFNRHQPELTARGAVWTWLVGFGWPARGYTQVTIRDCDGEVLVGHGRIYAVSDEDGA